MDQNAKFWNKAALDYSKSPIGDMKRYEDKLQISRTYFSSDTAALEIGCGTGSTALLHAPYVKSYRAIDFSASMIEIANAKLQKENIENVIFEHSTIADLKVLNPVDAILALSVLHLVDDPDEVIKQAYEWLKPDGVFITSTVCLGDKWKFIKFIEPIGRFFKLMPSVQTLTVAQIKESLENNGFKIEHSSEQSQYGVIGLFITAKKCS